MSGLGSVLFRRGLGGWSSGIIGWHLEVGLELDGEGCDWRGVYYWNSRGERREEEDGEERDER